MAQAIPTYVMSVFKLPFWVCDDLTKMMRQYWWGVENGKKKMAWKAWDKLVLPKNKGGILVFETCRHLTKLSWLSRLGGCWKHQIHFVPDCCEQNTIQMVIWLIRCFQVILLLSGKVLLMDWNQRKRGMLWRVSNGHGSLGGHRIPRFLLKEIVD